MKIYTGRGDEGDTQLLGGKRVPKNHYRITAYGTVDELNAFTGHLRSQSGVADSAETLEMIQDKLFVIGAYLATAPDSENVKLPQLSEEHVRELEASIDRMDEELPPLQNFVLPGGHPGNAAAHVCRTVCRRAEREVVLLRENEPVDPRVIQYLNRLSDWFFVFARLVSFRAGAEEILWKPS